MSLIKDIIYYFTVYRKYLGYRIYIVFILTGLAALTEAFGIAMLLPLIEMVDMDTGDSQVSDITLFMQGILDFIGIGGSMIGVFIFIGAIFFLKGIIKFAEGAYKAVLQSSLQREMKGKVFRYYSRMNYHYYSKYNTGHFVNIIAGQVSRLIKSFDSYKKFLSEIVITLSFLAFAFVISWQFALMAAVVGIIILLLFKNLNAYVRNLSRKTAEEQSSLNKFLVQTLQSWKYLTATAQMEHLEKGVFKSINRLTWYFRNQGIADGFTLALKEPVSIILIITIIIIQLSVFNAPLAPIFVSLILINRAMGHIITIQSAWQQTMNSIGSLEMVEKEMSQVSQYQEEGGKTGLPLLHRSIIMKDVSFSYNRKSGMVLKEINLEIKVNTTVAFVGESGAGKSTLVDMLTLMLKPDKGKVIIDGIPHDDIDLISWRRQIGYVSQDTIVFDDTVANNICMWKGDYNADPQIRKEIETAAGQAYATQFISGLPAGFNTMVGDRGVRLSGGQKQRLFIARELFKNPRFLILDEATSALDSESERFIKESIDNLKGSATVAIIAHRLSTIRKADFIYVLDNGRIVESGTYEELIASGRNFHKMVELQTL
jgi:ABC-type multidrug transport system fused ATPase/permease subunit